MWNRASLKARSDLHVYDCTPICFRVYYSDDGYVWTAYNSRLSSADLGQVFESENIWSIAGTVEFDPPIRVRQCAWICMIAVLSTSADVLFELVRSHGDT